MGYEQAKFGDGSASGSGNVTTTVNNHYGTRDSGQNQGNTKTEGKQNEMTFEFTGADVTAEAFPLLAPELPAGSVIKEVYAYVSEAFAISGTSTELIKGARC